MASIEKTTQTVLKTVTVKESVYTLTLTQDEMDALRTALGHVALPREINIGIGNAVAETFGAEFWRNTPFSAEGSVYIQRRDQ